MWEKQATMWIKSTLPATRIYGAGEHGPSSCEISGKDQNYPGASFQPWHHCILCLICLCCGELWYMVRCSKATSWVSNTFFLQLWQPQMSPDTVKCPLVGVGQYAKVLCWATTGLETAPSPRSWGVDNTRQVLGWKDVRMYLIGMSRFLLKEDFMQWWVWEIPTQPW